MKTKFNKILSILLVFALVCPMLVFSVSAAEDFTWSAYDKGYVTLVFDDGKMPITDEAAQLFEEYDMPMSAAIPAKLVEYGNDLYNALVRIQNNGGEILSHGYNHIPIVDTSNPDYANKTNNAGKYVDTSLSTAATDIDYELGESWRKLNDLGFKVNGMIEVGCGGAEGTADYEMVESIARKYYKYSNGSGVSAQYKISRRSTSWDTMENLKKRIDNAATNKSWVVLYAHTFKEISRDAGTTDSSALREVLQHIKDKNGAVEVVTYNDMYEKFGNYTGDAVPTKESIATLDPTETKDYYVKSMGYEALDAGKYDATKINGSGDSAYAVGTKENPAATVLDVIKAINADGLGVGDTANVYIMQRDNWNVYDNTAVGHEEVSGNKTFYIPHHNMTAWAHSEERADNKAPEAHAWTMVVKGDTSSATDNGKVYLTYGDRLGTNHSMQLGGPTVFDDVTVVTMRRSLDRTVMFNGNDVTFESGATYGYINLDYADKGTNRKVWDGTVTSYNSLAHQLIADGANTSFGGMTVNMNNAYATNHNAKFYVVAPSSGSSKTVTFTDDVTININNASANPTMIMGVNTATSKVAFDNLNINLKAGEITTTAVTTGNMTANAVQVIMEKGTTATNLESNISALGITNYYLLTNATNHKGVIEFTSTGGVFKVTDGYVVTATHSDGTTVKSDGTRLKLTKPGAYTYSVNVTKDYYVKSMGYEELDAGKYDATKINGSGDSAYAIGTKENPAATVLDVIAAINDDGLGEGDVANVYIMQRDDWNEYDGSKIGKNADGTFAIPHHNMTAWAHSETTADNKKPESHKWTMVVKGDTSSATDSGRVYLTYGDRLGTNHSLNVSGPTVFENVTITMMRSSRDRAVFFNNNDVSFASSCTYGYINNSYHTTSLAEWDKTVKTSAIASLPNSLIAEGVNTTQNSMTVNLNNAYTGSFYIPTTSSGSSKNFGFDGDININVNNSAAAPKFTWYVKGSNTSIALENVNIYVGAGKVSNSIAAFGSGSSLTANAVQAIVENGASLVDLDATLTTLGITNYYVINNTGDKNAIDFVRDADGNSVVGQFTVSGDTTAVAANSEGAVVAVSSDGVLKITTPGIYEIRFIDTFDNNGTTLTVYKSGEIDLSAIEHTEKDGKLFIGWKKADGTWPETTAEYTAGDVLTAQYIDFTEADFAINNVDLTTENGLKLNMGFAQTTAIDAIPNIIEKGVIWVKADIAGGREIRIDEPIVKTWKWDSADKTKFSAGNTLSIPNKSANSNSVAIDVSSSDYNTFYTARGYIKYTDNNGIANIIYSEEDSTSAYKLAKEATDSKAIYTTIIEKVKADNEAFVKGINETVVATYDKSNTSIKRNTDSYDVFSQISGAGSGVKYKRTVYLPNIKLKETVNLGWLSDNHFNYINKTDIEKNVENALSSYRGRSWLRDGSSINNAIDQVNYMNKVFNKTIVTGDMVDYLSYGSLYATKTLIADKSINGSILMTTGNHEFAEWCQADEAVIEKMTLAEKYELLSKSWSNDPTYYAEILKTQNGEDNVMIVLLDNGRSSGYYADGTLEKLQASVAEAREKNIPVLLFQHVGLSTFNDAETKIYYNRNNLGFATASDADGYYDMTTYNTKGGDVTTFIRKNYDIIKGVFVGHEHAHMYTEITALDENCNIVEGEYIPQFVTSSSAYGCVNEIVLKAKCTHSYEDCADTECDLCGEDRVAPGHSFTNYVANNDATCTKDGTKTAACDNGCGEKDTITDVGTKLGHKSDNGTVTKKATCKATGIKTYKCTECDAVIKTETIAKIAHSYKTTTTKATTKKNGSIVKKCSVCGVQASKSTIYYAKKVKLSTTEYTYSSSKTRKPSVKVYDYKGNKISSKYYTVSYATGRKKVGKYKVTIKLKGKYSGTLKAYFTIVPKESKVEKLTAAKKSLKVKLKKVSSGSSGYEIQYSTSKTFKSKYTKTKKVTSYKTTSVTLKSLKAKKTYYVRVRTYKTVDGKKYYSDWSSKKTKKTK